MTVLPKGGIPGLVTWLVDRQRRVVPSHVVDAERENHHAVALRRAVVRRAGAVIDGNRYWRRLLSLARWAFPHLWSAFAGSESTALAVRAAGPTSVPWHRRDTLAVDVTEHLADLQESRARVERFTSGRGHGADRRTGPWAGPVASMQRTTTARTASWQSQRTEEPPWHRRPDVPDPLEAALLPGEGDHNCEIVSFINFRRVASPDGRENCSYATSG
jgi:hypothetical protein